MDLFDELIDRIVARVARVLIPKLDALAHQQEVAAHHVEVVRVTQVAMRETLKRILDRLDTAGGLTPAQLTQLTDSATALNVAAETLQAAQAAQATPTPKENG